METGPSVCLFWVGGGSIILVFCFFQTGSDLELRLSLNSLHSLSNLWLSSCLTLLGTGITGVSFHAQLGPHLFCLLVNPVATLLI